MDNVCCTHTYVWYATYIQYVAYWNLVFSGYTFVYNIIIHIKMWKIHKSLIDQFKPIATSLIVNIFFTLLGLKTLSLLSNVQTMIENKSEN